MAKGWRKNDYNRHMFGQKVKEARLTLHWSLGHLAQRSGLNKGTLQHVEKGEVHLPDAKRQILIDVLTEVSQEAGQSTNRRELLNLADLPTTSAVLHAVSSSPHLQSEAIANENNQKQPLQERSHEEYAEFLNQQGEWQLAGTFWLLAAHEGKASGDWAKWSRCLLHAGLMALTCDQFALAEQRFKEVLEQSQDEMAPLARVEAYIRLGWLYYAQDTFSQARQALLQSRTLLQNVASKYARSLRFSEHGSILVLEGREVIKALEATRLHWLGRTYVDWGIQQDNQALMKEGLAKLQKNAHYDHQLGFHGNAGFALLRQIPALLYEGNLETTEKYLAQSEELLGTRGTAKGHIYLHKGLLTLEDQPKQAKDYLEIAREGFLAPTFYPKGLSAAFKEMRGAYLMDGRKTGDEMALRYAFVSAILHPYGRNVELLQLAAHKMYWRLGENLTAFESFWRTVVEKLWRMETEPFSDLRYVMKSFREDGIAQVETAIEKASKAVHNELVR